MLFLKMFNQIAVFAMTNAARSTIHSITNDECLVRMLLFLMLQQFVIGADSFTVETVGQHNSIKLKWFRYRVVRMADQPMLVDIFNGAGKWLAGIGLIETMDAVKFGGFQMTRR